MTENQMEMLLVLKIIFCVVSVMVMGGIFFGRRSAKALKKRESEKWEVDKIMSERNPFLVRIKRFKNGLHETELIIWRHPKWVYIKSGETADVNWLVNDYISFHKMRDDVEEYYEKTRKDSDAK